MSYQKRSHFRLSKLSDFVLDHIIQVTLVFITIVIGLIVLNRTTVMSFISSLAPEIASFSYSTDRDTTSTTLSEQVASNSVDENKSSTASSTTAEAEPSGDIPAEEGATLSEMIDGDIVNNDSAADQYNATVETENDGSSTFTDTVSDKETNSLSDTDTD